MKTVTVHFALVAMVFTSVARAQPPKAPRWSVRAGWEYTSLGDARPDGFGVTGGSTVRAGVDIALMRGGITSVVGIADARSFGFADERARTMGVELDLGAAVVRRVHIAPLFEQPLAIGLTASVGVFRSPLETAIGRMRFVGIRPAFGVLVGYTFGSGFGLRADGGCRLYSTLVWTGCAWGFAVSGTYSR